MARNKKKKKQGSKSTRLLMSNSSRRGLGPSVINVGKEKNTNWRSEFGNIYDQHLRKTTNPKIAESPFVGNHEQHKIFLKSKYDGPEIKIPYKDYQAIIGQPDLQIDIAMICGRGSSYNAHDTDEQMEDLDGLLNIKTLRSIWPISEDGLESAKKFVKTFKEFKTNRHLRIRALGASIIGGKPDPDDMVTIAGLPDKMKVLPRRKYTCLTIIFARLYMLTKEKADLTQALTNLEQLFSSGTHNLAHLDKKHQVVLIQYASFIFSFAGNYVGSETDNITESVRNIITLMFGKHIAENNVPAAMAQWCARSDRTETITDFLDFLLTPAEHWIMAKARYSQTEVLILKHIVMFCTTFKNVSKNHDQSEEVAKIIFERAMSFLTKLLNYYNNFYNEDTVHEEDVSFSLFQLLEYIDPLCEALEKDCSSENSQNDRLSQQNQLEELRANVRVSTKEKLLRFVEAIFSSTYKDEMKNVPWWDICFRCAFFARKYSNKNPILFQ